MTETKYLSIVPTKNGNGFKINVNGVWYYASRENLAALVKGEESKCTFRTISDRNTNE